MAEYEIKDTDIEESMRRIGTAFRRIRPYQDEEFFRKTNMAEDKLIKGKWAPVHTDAEERFIPRGDGSELRVLICRAKNVEKRKSGAAGLLWIHGGGYATGVPEQDHLFADIFCTEGECVAVMPAFRFLLRYRHADRLRRQRLSYGGNRPAVLDEGEPAHDALLRRH